MNIEYTIILTEEQLDMLQNGDYTDVEAVIQDILEQTGSLQ